MDSRGYAPAGTPRKDSLRSRVRERRETFLGRIRNELGALEAIIIRGPLVRHIGRPAVPAYVGASASRPEQSIQREAGRHRGNRPPAAATFARVRALCGSIPNVDGRRC